MVRATREDAGAGLTVIVGLVGERRLWMASDSMVSEGSITIESKDPKIRRVATGLLIGAAGSSVGCDFYLDWDWSGFSEDQDAGTYLKEQRNAMRLTRKSKEIGADLLICAGSDVYAIDGDYGFTTYRSPYGSIGSGSDVALGVLYATEGRGKSVGTRKRIDLVLRACSSLVHGCGGADTVLSTRRGF